VSHREGYQQAAEQRINHAQKYGVTWHRGEIIEAASESLQQICRPDAADSRINGARAGADEKM
jgi:hypothetical protein